MSGLPESGARLTRSRDMPPLAITPPPPGRAFDEGLLRTAAPSRGPLRRRPPPRAATHPVGSLTRHVLAGPRGTQHVCLERRLADEAAALALAYLLSFSRDAPFFVA